MKGSATRATPTARVAIRADASAIIGGGHVMRCLAIAEELTAHASVKFVSTTMTTPLAHRLECAGVKLAMIQASGNLPDAMGWEANAWSIPAQELDARRTIAALDGEVQDVVVLDHYLLSEAWERAMRSNADQLVVVDDWADRIHSVDILVDQTLGRSEEDYAPSAIPKATMLLGSRFALLRRDFARLRPAAIAQRASRRPAHRILVAMGAQDPQAATAKVVDAIVDSRFDGMVDVVLGRDTPSFAYVAARAKSDARFMLHFDVTEMAHIMLTADLAVGAAGFASWERCAMGLPSIHFTLAANQNEIGRALANAGVSEPALKFGTALTRQIEALTADADRRHAMSEVAFSVADGEGAERVARILLDRLATAVSS